MISLKTGALIECSVTLGAIASKKDIDNFLYNLVSTFGRDIGLLFQIRDDLLGVWGTDKTGKPVGADIKRKKKSLPIILSLNSENKSASEKINEILSKNKDKVDQYKAGKEKLFGFFVGQVMKLSGGKANPQLTNEILKKLLKG